MTNEGDSDNGNVIDDDDDDDHNHDDDENDGNKYCTKYDYGFKTHTERYWRLIQLEVA